MHFLLYLFLYISLSSLYCLLTLNFATRTLQYVFNRIKLALTFTVFILSLSSRVSIKTFCLLYNHKNIFFFFFIFSYVQFSAVKLPISVPEAVLYSKPRQVLKLFSITPLKAASTLLFIEIQVLKLCRMALCFQLTQQKKPLKAFQVHVRVFILKDVRPIYYIALHKSTRNKKKYLHKQFKVKKYRNTEYCILHILVAE